MIKLKFKDIHSNPYVLSELILTAKIMRKKNFKIQMLAGNTLKIGVGGSFEISTTLVITVSIFVVSYENDKNGLLKKLFCF